MARRKVKEPQPPFWDDRVAIVVIVIVWLLIGAMGLIEAGGQWWGRVEALASWVFYGIFM